MKRRTAISNFVTGLALVTGGCIGQGARRESTSTPGSSMITSTSFEILGDDKITEHPKNPPNVDFNTDKKQVVITGRLLVGSEKCKEAKLESVIYKESRGHPSVVVSDGKSDAHPDNQFLSSGSCDEVMSSDGYEVTVSFREDLPAKVTAIERDAAGKTKSTTAKRDTQ